MKIIVLTGGNSAERNVALASGRAIANGLRSTGHEVRVVDPVFGAVQPTEEEIFGGRLTVGQEFPTAEELKSYSSRNVLECISSGIFDNIDIVFLGLHGKFGEDGRVQSLLEMRGVKYTGSGVTSSAMSLDKDISKIILSHAGISTPGWFMLEGNNMVDTDIDNKIKSVIGYPAVIKPNDEGSTVGLSIVQPDVEDVQLGKAVKYAFEYSERVMVEEYIPGRELTVAILGDDALPVVEIMPKDGFYDYEHKYTKGMTQYICPAELSESLENKMRDDAKTAHTALGCKAVSRVDYRLAPDGKFYCLEVNTLPGMTELSLVPKAASAVGMNFTDLLNKIIELSL